jgi:hypothetical protein
MAVGLDRTTLPLLQRFVTVGLRLVASVYYAVNHVGYSLMPETRHLDGEIAYGLCRRAGAVPGCVLCP